MMTQAQLADEQRKETQFNSLFDKVIAKTPWGGFYSLMITASNALTAKLPKRICLDPDGRPIVVYQGDIAKIVGEFAEPTHKKIATDFSEKKWGLGILDIATGGLAGQVASQVQQRNKKNICFNISPDEVAEIYKRKLKAVQDKKDAATALQLQNQSNSIANTNKELASLQAQLKMLTSTTEVPHQNILQKIETWIGSHLSNTNSIHKL